MLSTKSGPVTRAKCWRATVAAVRTSQTRSCLVVGWDWCLCVFIGWVGGLFGIVFVWLGGWFVCVFGGWCWDGVGGDGPGRRVRLPSLHPQPARPSEPHTQDTDTKTKQTRTWKALRRWGRRRWSNRVRSMCSPRTGKASMAALRTRQLSSSRSWRRTGRKVSCWWCLVGIVCDGVVCCYSV